MRNLLSILLFALLAISVASCADDSLPVDNTQAQDSTAGAIRFKGRIVGLTRPGTRHTIDSASNWKNMVSRRMSVLLGGVVYDNYYVDTVGNIYAAMGPYAYLDPAALSVPTQAWYPYTIGAPPTTFSIKTDQSLFANIEHSDFLYGKQNPGTRYIDFHHGMSQIEIHLRVLRYIVNDTNRYDTIYAPIDSVKICGSAITGQVDIDNMTFPGGIVPRMDSTVDITCYHYKDSDKYITQPNGHIDTFYCYRAIVYPQDTILTLRVKLGGVKYEGKIMNKRYERGMLYNVRVYMDMPVTFNHYDIGDYIICNADGDIGGARADELALAKKAGYKPVALIFSDSTSTEDRKRGWTHGYAISLVEQGGYLWSTNTTNQVQADAYGMSWTNAVKKLNGYDETHRITDNSKYNASTYPAFFAAVNYSPAYNPNKRETSGWFLPSMGQWYQLLLNLGRPSSLNVYTYSSGGYDSSIWPNQRTRIENNLNAYVSTAAPYAPAYSWFWPGYTVMYWASSEVDSAHGVIVGCDSNADDAWDDYFGFYCTHWPKNYSYCSTVRAAIAF